MSNTKKNLLITLGDSWTEGYGSYLLEAMKEYQSDKDLIKLQTDSADWMATHCWPAYLARILDCDLINLGYRGSANSAHAKWLLDQKINPVYKHVQVVWLLSDPHRFSFYSVEHEKRKRDVLNFAPVGILHNRVDCEPAIKTLAENYLSLVDLGGVVKETQFYIRIVENYCQLNNYNLLIGNAFTPTIFDSKHNIHAGQVYNSMQQFLGDNIKTTSSVCAHPNDLGYQKIAEELAQILQKLV